MKIPTRTSQTGSAQIATARFLFPLLVLIAAGTQWNVALAHISYSSCDEDPEWKASWWPLTDDVPAPRCKSPYVMIVQPRTEIYELEKDNLSELGKRRRYSIVQALPDGSARVKRKKLNHYQNIYNQNILIGSDTQPQAFAIDGMNYPIGKINGRFFNKSMAIQPEGQIAHSSTLPVKLHSKQWQLSTECEAADHPEYVYSCRLQATGAGAPQILMYWNWTHPVTSSRDSFDDSYLRDESSLEIEYSINPQIVFAGDIDNDNKLDLLLLTPAYRDAGCTYWHLLSERQDGKLALTAFEMACD